MNNDNYQPIMSVDRHYIRCCGDGCLRTEGIDCVDKVTLLIVALTSWKWVATYNDKLRFYCPDCQLKLKKTTDVVGCVTLNKIFKKKKS